MSQIPLGSPRPMESRSAGSDGVPASRMKLIGTNWKNADHFWATSMVSGNYSGAFWSHNFSICLKTLISMISGLSDVSTVPQTNYVLSLETPGYLTKFKIIHGTVSGNIIFVNRKIRKSKFVIVWQKMSTESHEKSYHLML